MKVFLENVARAIKFLFQGQWRRVYNEVHVRIYRAVYEVLFLFIRPVRRRGRRLPPSDLKIETQHPVAFESPDHIAPKGTAENNSTNKKFILHLDELLHRAMPDTTLRCLDLGCSGGQMVKDFISLHWLGAGLEGSDYSLKRRRAHWATLANKNLFTCDITKPFSMRLNGNPLTFHLITAWEVLEHIATPDLPAVFDNIWNHLEPGGIFIASTTRTPDIHNGIELHQTKWSNHEWRRFVEKRYPELEYMDVGLKIYQFVRYNFLDPSFLTYRKKTVAAVSR
jgi:2-polyprenyl-3-methyl-5-hydroxy-6-metoxy-1,4-benzoquinol methylase